MVTTWGTGRKDWSQNIELITVPIARSHQIRAFPGLIGDLTLLPFMTIDDEPIYGTIGVAPDSSSFIHAKTNYYVFFSKITFDANVLIKAYYGLVNLNTGEYIRKQVKYGYGKVQFNFPKGFVLTLEEMKQGWDTVLEFLPGGYIVRYNEGGMLDKYVE